MEVLLRLPTGADEVVELPPLPEGLWDALLEAALGCDAVEADAAGLELRVGSAHGEVLADDLAVLELPSGAEVWVVPRLPAGNNLLEILENVLEENEVTVNYVRSVAEACTKPERLRMGRTPIRAALRRGLDRCAQVLLECKFRDVNRNTLPVLEWCCEDPTGQNTLRLFRSGRIIQEDLQVILPLDNLPAVQLIADEFGINTPLGDSDYRLVHFAGPNSLRWLLNNGADIATGVVTPLHTAAAGLSPERVSVLVEYGAERAVDAPPFSMYRDLDERKQSLQWRPWMDRVSRTYSGTPLQVANASLTRHRCSNTPAWIDCLALQCGLGGAARSLRQFLS